MQNDLYWSVGGALSVPTITYFIWRTAGAAAALLPACAVIGGAV